MLALFLLCASNFTAVAYDIINQRMTLAVILKNISASNDPTRIRKVRKMMTKFLPCHTHKDKKSRYFWFIRLYKPYDVYHNWRDYQYWLRYNKIHENNR